MNGKTCDVSMENFESIVDSNPLVFLDFWADWCTPCKVFSPVYEYVAEKHPDVFFGKVNTEIARDLAAAFQVRSIPTLMVFKGGELVFEESGLFSPQQLEGLVHQYR